MAQSVIVESIIRNQAHASTASLDHMHAGSA